MLNARPCPLLRRPAGREIVAAGWVRLAALGPATGWETGPPLQSLAEFGMSLARAGIPVAQLV